MYKIYTMSHIFYNPSNQRIYLTNGNPTVLPLPVGLTVTLDKSNMEGKIVYHKKEDDTYTLDIISGKSEINDEQAQSVTNWVKSSDFRLSPDKVNIKYNSADNTVSFSPKTVSGGSSAKNKKKSQNSTRKNK